ncbi:GAP1 [[Candida] subhashii]|uniref:GAP1 n=1 Tax=[Candida] subhashii TaxID=561895 RepID=A0A8J5QK42_9ASCO|nr:GAP1 [[Candida] subhashii]KAG7663598.1 GAP1 [[Candida] subhashii]
MTDIEKNTAFTTSSDDVATDKANNGTTQTEQPSLTGWAKFKDGFKRAHVEDYGLDPNMPEVEKIAILTARSALHRKLKNRHLQMIAIGGAIGTGLFIGSGSALSTAGPAGLLLGYILIGTMIYCTVQSLGELAVTFPIAGAFITYNSRFIDPSWGFAMAWNYALQWLVILPLELVAASLTIKYWDPNTNSAAYVSGFFFFIISINFFGVRGYGEAEFIFSATKVIAICGFIILGIVLIVGGGPQGGYIGDRNWYIEGAPFPNGAKGVVTVFVGAAFAFIGTELCGLAAAESDNPRRALPKACKQVFWRITLFYVICLTLVGLLVPYDNPRLLGASSVDATASPFVIAIQNGGISGLPSVMNVVIMISVLSVGNSSVFGSSRTLAALAAAKQAPAFLGYVDRKGRPLMAILVQLSMGFLCYLAATPKQDEVFGWMLSISGLSSIFSWASINFCLIRFRRAMKAKGRDTSELTFASQPGLVGAWWGVLLNVVVVCLQFWIAVFPLNSQPSAKVFFSNFLTVPVVLLFYFGHKIYTRNWSLYIRTKDIDIDTGRREADLEVVKQEVAEEKEYLRSLPFYKRVYNFWC